MTTCRTYAISVKIPIGALTPDEGLAHSPGGCSRVNGERLVSAIIRRLQAVMIDTSDGVAQAPATSAPSRQQMRCGGITGSEVA